MVLAEIYSWSLIKNKVLYSLDIYLFYLLVYLKNKLDAFSKNSPYLTPVRQKTFTASHVY